MNYPANPAESRQTFSDFDEWLNETPDPPRPPLTCSWCIEWSDRRQHCNLRAKADLEQLPKTHAPKCHFYVEDCPF